MLKLFTEGRIKLMAKEEKWLDYNDKAKGKVPVYRYYVQVDNDKGESEVLEIKSDNEFSKLVDVPAVFTVGFWEMFDKESGVTRAGIKLLDVKAAATA